jgi:hypothetical protein
MYLEAHARSLGGRRGQALDVPFEAALAATVLAMGCSADHGWARGRCVM